MRKLQFRKLKRWLKRIYHFFVPEKPQIIHHTYDARELFFQEHYATGFNRYDIIVRLLAVECFYGENDFGWELYLKQQNKRQSEDWEIAEEKFRTLIESYEKHGYDQSSGITLGADLRLWDGAHRMALAFYHHNYNLSCQVMPVVRTNIFYDITWYVENDFTLSEIEKIKQRYEQLKQEIQIPFICTLWAPVASYFDEITEKLQLFCNVESYKDYSFADFSYAQMARMIYAVDDIDKASIEKKIEYMRLNVMDGAWKMREVKLFIDTPQYRIKDTTQNPLSVKCEQIKRIIRSCYKDKVPTYYHDVICHIGDNFYQNEYIDTLFNTPKTIVSDIFKGINAFEYAIVKFNAPSIPEDFPNSYPLGKDIDIVCKNGDLNRLLTTIEDVIRNILPTTYTCRREYFTSNRTQIRIELQDVLICAFDVYSQTDSIDLSFFEDLLAHKTQYNGVYLASKPYDLVLRIYEILNYPQKVHHLYYIGQNIKNIDDLLCKKYLSQDAKDILEKVKSGEINCDEIEEDNMQWGGVKYCESNNHE